MNTPRSLTPRIVHKVWKSGGNEGDTLSAKHRVACIIYLRGTPRGSGALTLFRCFIAPLTHDIIASYIAVAINAGYNALQ